MVWRYSPTRVSTFGGLFDLVRSTTIIQYTPWLYCAEKSTRIWTQNDIVKWSQFNATIHSVRKNQKREKKLFRRNGNRWLSTAKKLYTNVHMHAYHYIFVYHIFFCLQCAASCIIIMICIIKLNIHIEKFSRVHDCICIRSNKHTVCPTPYTHCIYERKEKNHMKKPFCGHFFLCHLAYHSVCWCCYWDCCFSCCHNAAAAAYGLGLQLLDNIVRVSEPIYWYINSSNSTHTHTA